MTELPEGFVRKDSVVLSSKVELYEQCPATHAYRLAKELVPKPHTGLFWGILIHRFLEYATERGNEQALDYINTKKWEQLKKTCRNIDLDALPSGQAEVGYAHNPSDAEARALFGAFSVNQVDKLTEQYGKADMLVPPQEGVDRWTIVDWKSGYKGEKPLETTQMLGLGASVMLTEDVDSVDLALVKIHGSGALDWHTQTMWRSDMRAWNHRARRIHLTVLENRVRADRGDSPDFITGDECGYCELKPACPAHK